MPNFVRDGVVLPGKTDIDPLPPSAAASNYWAADDINEVYKPAIDDLRNEVINGESLGLAPQSVRPAAPTNGSTRLAWVRLSDNHLMYFDGTIDRDISGGHFTVVFVATPTFNITNGTFQTITLTANITSYTMTAGPAGAVLSVQFIQGGGGGFTLAGTPANVKLAGSALTLTVAAGKRDMLTFISDGTNWIEVSRSLNSPA